MDHYDGFDLAFPNAEHAAQAAAADITAVLGVALRQRGRSVLAVCGGNSAAMVLRHLHLDHPLVVFATDERWVSLDSSERNDRVLIERFGESSVVRAPYSGQINNDADRWATMIWQHGTPDAVLLSMADDGHIASLFPGSTTLASHAPVVIETNSPKPPSSRLSMSASLLRQVPYRLVLAIGGEKATVIHQIRQGREVPATRITPTRWYLDSAASSANGG